MMADGAAVLEWRGVSVRYAGSGGVALDGVDLCLREGEVLGILGPNGSGKSTLVHTGSGWIRPQSGEVLVEGVRLSSLGRLDAARRIALVAQSENPPGDLSVWEFVGLGRYPHLGGGWLGRSESAADREAVVRAIRLACLEGYEGRLLGTLSGGECQRVLLARAIAHEPAVLLLDEPNASLDPAHQIALVRLVRGLVGEGRVRAAVVVLHDLNLAGLAADRLVLLRQGRVEAVGGPEDVLRAEVLERVYGTELEVLVRSDGRRVVALSL